MPDRYMNMSILGRSVSEEKKRSIYMSKEVFPGNIMNYLMETALEVEGRLTPRCIANKISKAVFGMCLV